MSLLNYFRREPPLYQTDNLWNYIKAYPSRVADEAREALQGISDPITRMSSAAQLITSPIAPVSEDLFSQLGQFAAPGINRHQQAIIDAQNQLAERLNLPTQDYTPMSDEQVSQQLAMLGSLMRGKFPNWVSPSQIAIRGFQPKATGQQYAKALEKEKGAIAEAKETGLLKALQETPGTITQEQALSLVSPLELTETIKGVTEVPSNPTLLDAKTFFGITDEDWNKMTPYQQQSYVDEIREGGRHIQRSDDTKYGREENLNLPGGTNPKEILVQLPYSTKTEYGLYSEDGELFAGSFPTREAAERSIQDQRGTLVIKEYDVPDSGYMEGHWDEPNVLVHIRTNERFVGGKKALHSEEYQSDWSQDPNNPYNPFKKNWHELGWKRHFMEALRDPSIERLTWTTGDVQVDRNDLAKYIDEITAIKQSAAEFQKVTGSSYNKPVYRISVKYKNGRDERFDVVEEEIEKLPKYVGKEMADRIVEDADGTSKNYSGLDLEIGGEFHKNLYDKKIPQFVKKFLKDFGVEPQRTPSEFEIVEDDDVFAVWRKDANDWIQDFKTERDAENFIKELDPQLWYIDITPEMREHFMKQGIKMTMAPNQMGLLPEQEMRLLA